MKNLITFIFSLILLNASAQKVHLYENDTLFRNEVLKYIPIGSDLETAKAIMKKNKFRPYEHLDSPIWKNNKEIYSHVDYIDFNHTKAPILGFISTTWEIFVLFNGNKVTEIVTSIEYTGP